MDNSPFSKLLTELHNQIYEMVLVERTSSIRVSKQHKECPFPLALLQTCHEIRRQAALIFYGQHAIFIYGHDRAEVNSVMVDRLRALGTARQLLRQMRIARATYSTVSCEKDGLGEIRRSLDGMGVPVDHVELIAPRGVSAWVQG